MSLTQTLFMGASIVSFSSKVGWNSESSTLEVQLAEDKSIGNPKVYYDGHGYPQIYVGPDFFNPPRNGSCVYFQYGNFRFVGILQNWQQRKTITGTVYTVRLVSTSILLAGTKVILANYTGPAFNVPNLLNVYGYLEDNYSVLSYTVPDYVNATTKYFPTGKFGGSARDDRGITWAQIKYSLSLIVNGIAWDDFRIGNYIVNPMYGKYGGRLQFGDSYYMIDLSEVPLLDTVLKFPDEQMSLLDIIAKVCEYSGYEFFIETVLWSNGGASGGSFDGKIADDVIRWIKIRVVGRGLENTYASEVDSAVGSPIDARLDTFGSISAAVDSLSLDVNQKNRGLELCDNITNAFLVGDFRSDIFQTFLTYDDYVKVKPVYDNKQIFDQQLQEKQNWFKTNYPVDDGQFDYGTCGLNNFTYGSGNADINNASIWYYWGKNDSGYPIYSSGIDAMHYAIIPIGGKFEQVVIEKYLQNFGNTDYILNAVEALCARIDYDSWLTVVNELKSRKSELFFDQLASVESFSVPNEGLNKLRLIGTRTGKAIWYGANNLTNAVNIGRAMTETDSGQNQDCVTQFYSYIKQLCDNYYGRKFIIDAPYIKGYRQDDNPLSVKTNYNITEGGWSEYPVIGLDTESTGLNYFRNVEDGKIYPFLYFEVPQSGFESIDLSQLDKKDYLMFGTNSAYVRCNVEEIIWSDPLNLIGAKIVVSIDGPIFSQVLVSQIRCDEDGIPIESDTYTLNKCDWKNAAAKLVQSSLTMGQVQDILTRGIPGGDRLYYPMSPLPLLPKAAAIPLQDQTTCYGPWIAYKDGTAYYGQNGRLEYYRDETLNPWNYSSTTNMENAGQVLVQTKTSKQGVAEVASLTIPGTPLYSLGDILLADGPNITSIDVNFGHDGVTTTYQFRTFTPNYNGTAKYRLDAMAKYNKEYGKIQRLYEKSKVLERKYNKDVVFPGITAFTQVGERFNRMSSHDFLLAHADIDYSPSGIITSSGIIESGVLYSWDNYSGTLYDQGMTLNSCVVTDLRKGLPEIRADNTTEYLHRAGIESIGLFRPFTSWSGILSHMAEIQLSGTFEASPVSGFLDPSGYYDTTNSLARHANPPVKGAGNPPICSTTLFPFMGSGNSVGGFYLGNSLGHDIEFILRNDTFPAYLSVQNLNDYQSSWYRGIGLRGPMIMVGWGYDLDGKPVPNQEYDQCGRAKTAFFEDNWLRKPHHWKAGPIDLRWDYDRNVWCSPNYARLYRVMFIDQDNYYADDRLTYPNYYGSGLVWAEILYGNDEVKKNYNPQGSGISATIRARNVGSYPVYSGLLGWVAYNPSYTGVVNYEKYDIVSIDQQYFSLITTERSNYCQVIVNYGAYVSPISGVPTRGLPDIPGYECLGRMVWYSGNIPLFAPEGTPTFISYGYVGTVPASGRLYGLSGSGIFDRPIINHLQVPTGVAILCTWVSNQWVLTNASNFELTNRGIV
jgi:hypothetical protein